MNDDDLARTEAWTKDGQTAYVDVTHDETVVVAYAILADMLGQLGFTKTGSRGDWREASDD